MTQKRVFLQKMPRQCLQQSLNEFATILFLSRAWQRTSRDRWSHGPVRPITEHLRILKDGRPGEDSPSVTSTLIGADVSVM